MGKLSFRFCRCLRVCDKIVGLHRTKINVLVIHEMCKFKQQFFRSFFCEKGNRKGKNIRIRKHQKKASNGDKLKYLQIYIS